jgi:dienelactone hydrolase
VTGARGRLAALALGLGLALSAPGPALAQAEADRETHEWIQVPVGFQQAIRAVVVWPGGQRRGPVVIVLHGTEGFDESDVELARQFAHAGFVGVAACWFAGEACPRGPAFRGATMDATESLRALLAALRRLPAARLEKVGFFGHSRGATLSLLLAAGGGVDAVVASGTQIAPQVTAGRRPVAIDASPLDAVATLRAPVLLLHGTADPVTDVTWTRRYEQALRDAGKPVEAYYYAGGPHLLPFDAQTREDVMRRSIAFLRRHLLGWSP